MTTSGINALYPRLVVSDASKAIDFYLAAFAPFGAEEVARYTVGGKIVHAEVRVGGLRLALKDEGDGDPAPGPVGRTSVIMSLEVDDADAVGAAMLAAGATVIYPIADQGYGSKGGRLGDPFGHQWMIMQQVEDLSPEEIQRRTNELYGD
jgi:PhnB protein